MEIIEQVEIFRKKLKKEGDFRENPIDLNLPAIPPFKGKEEIKLIVLGQDPTVKTAESRKRITCTLNLDKNNTLKRYIQNICSGLKINIENVYATNLFKYFYSQPPASTIEVLTSHLEPNLKLLQKELTEFKGIPIITLGEPVLKLLTNPKSKVRIYWDYNVKTKISDTNFKYCLAKDNVLKRDFFVFPHQSSLKKDFYKNTLKGYIGFMKNKEA